MVKLLTFKTENELVQAIDELKLQSVQSEDMTVVRNERPTGPFNSYKEIEFVKGDGSIWEAFVSRLFNTDRKDLVSRRFNFDNENKKRYDQLLTSGDFILLVPDAADTTTKILRDHYRHSDDSNSRDDDDNEATNSNTSENSRTEEKDFEDILDDYGLNSEREFVNDEK